MSQSYFAHTLPGRPESEWQPLDEHLNSVAEKARGFASAFGSGEWAYLAGLWHDLGKYGRQFQQYLYHENGPGAHIEDAPGRVDHSTAGAKHAVTQLGVPGHLLAYCIAGHHSGLLNGHGVGACMTARLAKGARIPDDVPESILSQPIPSLPVLVQEAIGRRDASAVALFVRMVFSCLVDADFLDTEHFVNPQQSELRSSTVPRTLALMEAALDEHLQDMVRQRTPVNLERDAVRAACLTAAVREKGLFSLTVPTGGGKTLASLAFALRHAQTHGLERIVCVVPFTSIIEQNADVFRRVMARLPGVSADDIVIEHHSNFDIERETALSRLACENWDAPLIVTTSVQFYESLFARRSSQCRKLHNLARAVIILDEAQALPVNCLHPCLHVLKRLVSDYGSTVVLCTATQPAVHKRDGFPIGLENVREIVPDPRATYRRLKRVEVADLGSLEDGRLADRLLSERQVLCVVNTRGHARSLFEMLGEGDGRFHLSGLMCPAHRTQTLDAVRERLSAGLPCRVISTQLIEAGVDIDFPVVFRAMAGVDSIAQAAGRCNRNGLLSEPGRVYVFRSEHRTAERFLADTAAGAEQVMEIHDDPLALEAVERYFSLYYWDQADRWDEKGIMRSFSLVQDRKMPFLFEFADVARRFRMIEQAGRPIVVPWGEEGRRLCERLRMLPALNRETTRRLQRFTVQIPERTLMEYLNEAIEPILETVFVLISPETHYSEILGLRLEHPSGDALFA